MLEAPAKQFQVLMVEDSPTDTMLAWEAFETTRINHYVHLVDNGADAMAFLRQQGRYKNKPRPDLILLDLNLPGKSGKEILYEIKEDEALRTIPVVILSSSKTEEDVLEGYRMNANCYIVKPVEFDKLAEVVQRTLEFWLGAAALPK